MTDPVDSCRRVPFSAADAESVVAFCVAHGGPRDAVLVKTLLVELTSDAAGVIVVSDVEGTAIVASVVDRIHNGADAASLETLGVRVPVPDATFARLVVEPAVAFARSGARRALHVALHPERRLARDPERVLRDAGFTPAFDGFEMRRPASAPLPPSDPPPPGWTWAALDAARVDDAYAALAAMFRDAPATSLKPLENFRAAVTSGVARWRALLDGDRVAGLVRAIAHGGGQGEIRVLGRRPEYRGQGLGPRLLAEGLRVLAEAGARDIDLSVEAANERALDLYRRFGFKVLTRTPVFGLALRG
jgi:ribosomal protein S18 acetylase RimI-like enzyme